MTEQIWANGMLIYWLVFGSVWGFILLVELLWYGKFWVNDNTYEYNPVIIKFMDNNNTDSAWVGFVVILGFCFVFAGGALWFICTPALFVIMIMFALRSFKRFQKKIHRALDQKSDVTHTH